MKRSTRRLASLGLAALLAVTGTAQADDIKEAIQEALQAYNKGDMAGTKDNLGYATQLINERGAEALAQAQALGYAEADPSFDIDGVDAAHKLSILAALSFGRRPGFDQVAVTGIREASCATPRTVKVPGFA